MKNTLSKDFDALEKQVEKTNAIINKLRDENKRLRAEVESLCPTCQKYKGQMHPPHFGSQFCESSSFGTKSHCTCEWCFNKRDFEAQRTKEAEKKFDKAQACIKEACAELDFAVICDPYELDECRARISVAENWLTEALHLIDKLMEPDPTDLP